MSEIAWREPLTHAGQSGTSLERIELADGRRLVIKRPLGDDWVARVTHDGGREASLWTGGVLARMPRDIDHAVLAAGREGTGTWLLMRDVSDELLALDRRLTREESRRLLAIRRELKPRLPLAFRGHDKVMQIQTETLAERVDRLVRESREPLLSTASNSAAIAELLARIETLERAIQEIADAAGVATAPRETV